MFKIGDFSQLGQVSVRTLHHYEDRRLLKPAEIEKFTGYRFYSLDQMQAAGPNDVRHRLGGEARVDGERWNAG